MPVVQSGIFCSGDKADSDDDDDDEPLAKSAATKKKTPAAKTATPSRSGRGKGL